MDKINDIAAVLIAGGRSSRMGTNKALLEFDGLYLAQRKLKLLQQVFSQIIVIVNDPEVAEVLEVPCYEDIISDVGPLGGLHAATVYSPTEQFFILPCDVPFIPIALISHLLTFAPGKRIAIPFADNRNHPLIGLYAKSYHDAIEQRILNGERAISDFVYSQNHEIVSIEHEDYYQPHILQNINTHEQYLEALKLLEL
jgi:molybdenum cofactor guanylyltransferase